MRHGEVDELGGDLGAEPGGRLGAARAHLDGQLAQLRGESGALGGQACQPLVVGVELEQAQPGVRGPREDVVGGAAVASVEDEQLGSALLDRGESQRVGVDARGIGGQVAAEVAEHVGDLRQSLGQRGQLGIVGLRGLQGGTCCADETGRVRCVGRLVTRQAAAEQGVMGRGCRTPQLLGMPEALGLGGQGHGPLPAGGRPARCRRDQGAAARPPAPAHASGW